MRARVSDLGRWSHIYRPCKESQGIASEASAKTRDERGEARCASLTEGDANPIRVVFPRSCPDLVKKGQERKDKERYTLRFSSKGQIGHRTAVGVEGSRIGSQSGSWRGPRKGVGCGST